MVVPLTMSEIAAYTAPEGNDWLERTPAERQAIHVALCFIRAVNRAIRGLHPLLVVSIDDLARECRVPVRAYREWLRLNAQQYSILDVLHYRAQVTGQPVLIISDADPGNPELWSVPVPGRPLAIAPAWN